MICSGRDKIETPEQVPQYCLMSCWHCGKNITLLDLICLILHDHHQLKQTEETVVKLDLDGLVVIGGDDSNTNACLLAENFRYSLLTWSVILCCSVDSIILVELPKIFRSKKMKTRVIGCPKTIDGDLKCKEVPTSFGFDTACKVSNMCFFFFLNFHSRFFLFLIFSFYILRKKWA